MRFRILLAAVCFAILLVPPGFSAFADGDEYGEEESGGDRDGVLPVVPNAAYQKECSACHLAYQPGLLPERSWRKVMGNLEDHFGDNAGLDDATRQEILNYLVKYSAERSNAEVSQEILASIPSGTLTLRISETGYFTRKHREIKPSVFKRKSVGSASNCSACHTAANEGNYEEDRVKIPGQ